jgi:hypothetical protein
MKGWLESKKASKEAKNQKKMDEEIEKEANKRMSMKNQKNKKRRASLMESPVKVETNLSTVSEEEINKKYEKILVKTFFNQPKRRAKVCQKNKSKKK